MERPGRLTIVLATLLVSSLEMCSCWAQPPGLPAARDDQAMERDPTQPESIDLRRPTDFAAFFRSPGESATPKATARRATIPPPRPFGQVSASTPPMAGAASPDSVAGDVPVRLKTALLEQTDVGFPINLATALRLSDARPLIVAAAQASVWVAEAQLTRAKVLWVPQLNIGGDYLRHDGGGPVANEGNPRRRA